MVLNAPVTCSKYITWYLMVSCIAPKWTGIWGAFATNPPSGPNIAQEKSKRSWKSQNLSTFLILYSIFNRWIITHLNQKSCWPTCKIINHTVSEPHFTHFKPLFHFYTPWKRKKTRGFLDVFRGYRNGTILAWNGFINAFQAYEAS